jgi:hypothetical protein
MTPETQSAPHWQTKRDSALARVESNAGPDFKSSARSFVVDYLSQHGEKSCEEITAAVWSAGIEAHDRRAMGPVMMSLARKGVIEKCGACTRKRGHGTSGGNLWRVRQAA